MEWQVVLALAIVVPAVLLPAAFVWYLNFGGIVQAVREARNTKATQKVAQEKMIATK